MSAEALHASGYTDLVKVARGDKRPVMPGWQALNVNRDMARSWEGANIGLRGDRFPAIDIDLGENAELAEEIVQWAARKLGGAPKRFSPKAGSRLLVYRSDDRFLKMKLTLPEGRGAVEVLPVGRQYLVKGIHPAGGPYTWNKRDLWDIPSKRLTAITEVQVRAFLDFLAEEYGGRVHVSREASEIHLSPEELRAPSVDAVNELVAQCPNNDRFLEEVFPSAGDPRDMWVAFGMAVKGAAGQGGLSAFLEWTGRYEDGVPDLSLAKRAYAGFAPERYGWPTLERIYRTQVETADNIFTDDLSEEVEPTPNEVPPAPTEEDVVRLLLPTLTPRLTFVAGAWWVWNGSKWEMDTKEGLRAEMVLRGFLSTYATQLLQQGEAMGKKEGASHRNMAKRLQSDTGIRAIFRLLRAPLSREADDFDRDLMALNTPAGLVDLRTGKVRATEPTDYVSRSTKVAMPTAYDPTKAPNWESFLDFLTRGSKAYYTFLQRYMGYSLTGRMDEKKLTVIYGAASNTGKSTFVNAVLYAMGDYATSVDVDMFMSKRTNTDDVAQLPGVRLVTATEPSAGQKWEDRLIKSVTGGDPITARRLYQSYFSFKPQFKILIAGNHQPELRSVDTALLKRVLIAPMDRVAEEPDVMLGEKLREEAGMILRWMLEGCLSWQRIGLSPPETVLNITQEYAEMEDTLMSWVDEEIDFDEGAWCATSDLFASWMGWMTRQNQRFVGRQNRFSRDLSARLEELEALAGHAITKHKRKAHGFTGLKLKDGF